MTAALAAVIPCTRAVSAGIEPDPGAAAGLPAWWGATDWVEVEVRGAVDEHRDVCRTHHVDPDTVVAVARAHAHYADFATGRDCRPTNDRVREAARVSQSTVQRARRVLKALGLMAVVLKGRSTMTRAERLEAWRRGSKHRQVAAVFALTSRRARAARSGVRRLGLVPERSRPNSGQPVDNYRGPSHLVERDHPPAAVVVQRLSAVRTTSLRDQSRDDERRSAPRSLPRSDPRARRLAEGVRFRLRWLAGTPTSRLAPLLTPYARAEWTAKDVDRAVVDRLAAAGLRLPREVKQPAAYLAWLLRPLDPADRPTAAEDARRAQERAENAWSRAVASPHAERCPHGQPGGNLPSPTRGHRTCPACRTEAAAAADRIIGW